MLFSTLLFLISPFIVLATPPPLPTTCFIGKICPWDWGSIYTIYEAQPNRTDLHQYPNPRLFEVSQEIDPDCGRPTHTPHNRIFTVTLFQPFSFETNGCHLDFNIPCNSSVPIYHHGHPIIAVHSLTSLPTSSPTWNNILPLIGPKVGEIDTWRRGTYEVLDGHACGNGVNGTNGDVGFVYEIDQSVGRGAGLEFNITLMNEDIIVGPFLNYTC